MNRSVSKLPFVIALDQELYDKRKMNWIQNSGWSRWSISGGALRKYPAGGKSNSVRQ
jgi:hypothetical protein